EAIQEQSLTDDMEGEALEALVAIKRTLAGEVAEGADLAAARRALVRVFDSFVLHFEARYEPADAFYSNLGPAEADLHQVQSDADWWIDPQARLGAYVWDVAEETLGGDGKTRCSYEVKFGAVPLGAKKPLENVTNGEGCFSTTTPTRRSSSSRGG